MRVISAVSRINAAGKAAVDKADLSKLTYRPVTRARWSDLQALFESPGAPKHCWCMVWRAAGKERSANSPPQRKRQMAERVESGMPVGILAYLGRQPVAWCSLAPRETYRNNVGGPPAREGERIWSLVCFFVKRQLRGEGVMTRLIEAAVDHARKKGANIVEAYPVPPDAPSYRFMGFVPVFTEAGFDEIGRAGIRRRVMRLTVG
jgi:GNAT superfamily N-acetyltransferase